MTRGPRSSLAADVRGIDEKRPERYIARRDSVYRRLLAFADVFSAALALILAVQIFGDDTVRLETLVALPLVVVVAKVYGLYDRDGLLLNKTTLDEAPKLFQLATLYTLLILLAQDKLVAGDLGVRQTIGLWLVLFVTTVLGRWLVRRLARRLTAIERVVVLGGWQETELLRHKLAENPSVHATIVGRIPLHSQPEKGTLGTAAELEQVVQEHGVHRVIVAPSESSYDETLDGIRAAKAVGVQVSVLPRLLEVVGSSVEFDQLYGLSVLGVRRFGLTHSSELIKRTMDTFGALVGLVLLSPAFVALALLIKLTSKGAVLFRQQRVGLHGEPFEVLKLRTMVDGAEHLRGGLAHANEAADGLFKIAEDPRLTRVGRVLRRSSLDELPQLVNVLRGEMSLVGPRPLIAEEEDRIEGRHRRRLHLKPGMTGQWQIFGSSKIPVREMVTIDYLYVANWSLWGDVKILCRTIPYMLGGRGQ